MNSYGMIVKLRIQKSNSYVFLKISKYFRLITEKFKEIEKTYKAQVLEQIAKASKSTVKGSASLLESSLRASPMQSMVLFS